MSVEDRITKLFAEAEVNLLSDLEELWNRWKWLLGYPSQANPRDSTEFIKD